MKKFSCGIFFLILATIEQRANGQGFSLGELSLMKPTQVIIENYTTVFLPLKNSEEPMANRFDMQNPYTYLQIMIDPKTTSYHIIFQTDFWGKVLFLCYSNNLVAVFNRADKPMFLFNRCLKNINDQLSPVQVVAALLTCMKERLNYCSGD